MRQHLLSVRDKSPGSTGRRDVVSGPEGSPPSWNSAGLGTRGSIQVYLDLQGSDELTHGMYLTPTGKDTKKEFTIF